VHNEAAVRLAAFGALFIALALWEAIAPRRTDVRRSGRWPLNLSLAALNAGLVRLLAPASSVTFAYWAQARDVGLFAATPWPAFVETLVAVAMLDGLVYVQHRLFHVVPLLWSLHRLHHADPGFDVTTGVRFHPLEIALSTLYKGAAVVALGASPLAVLLFELTLNLGSLFSHANVRLPGDSVWRLFVVTPDMHRTHHSRDAREQQRNFGFCLSWWDWLGGTYQATPRLPTSTMPLGLDEP
jgi:sterol desaturase/sphingolipid hydroxylase (fatty acid hydroxylase superfamily)